MRVVKGESVEFLAFGIEVIMLCIASFSGASLLMALGSSVGI